MKKLTIFFCAASFLASCTKDRSEVNVTNASPGKNAANVSVDDDLIWFGNGRKVQIYPRTADWNGTAILNWEPVAARGYSQADIDNWSGPSDFKVRAVPAWGGNWIVSSGGDEVIIAAYPSGAKRWSVQLGDVDPHSAELLPNGNCAIVGTKGAGWVRVYNSSGGTTAYGNSYSLPGAHSVLWDGSKLWAIGNDSLVSFSVSGLTLTKTSSALVPRAVTPNAPGYGHDISSDYNDSNKLWISVNGGVYSYNKSANTFTVAPGALGPKDQVKGISRHASGMFVVTQPDSFKSPVPSDPVLDPPYCTRYVDFYDASGNFLSSKKKTGVVIYKGKVFDVIRHPATLANGKYKITSRLNTNKAVTTLNAWDTDGTKIILYDYSAGNVANDEWNITKIGTTGYYRITSVDNGKDMVVENSGFANGDDMVLWSYSAATPVNDEWIIEDVGGGYYRVINRYSNKSLNVEGNSTANGTQLIQYTYSATNNNQWQFTLVP